MSIADAAPGLTCLAAISGSMSRRSTASSCPAGSSAKGGQIDPRVPLGEKGVIAFEVVGEFCAGSSTLALRARRRRRSRNSRELTRSPPTAVGEGWPSVAQVRRDTATAAGSTPGMRSAWPRVSGRVWVKRWTSSRESPGSPRTSSPAGIRASHPAGSVSPPAAGAPDSPRNFTVVSAETSRARRLPARCRASADRTPPALASCTSGCRRARVRDARPPRDRDQRIGQESRRFAS